jgi:acyl-CoA synthetase (AMP-forming)/AMP-acid ligase II
MSTARTEAQPLRAHLANAPADACLLDREARVRLGDLVGGTALGGRLAELGGRSVLIAAARQLTSALALIELDGVARRLTILPPDVNPDHLQALLAGAEIDAVVVDGPAPQCSHLPLCVTCTPDLVSRAGRPPSGARTEWVLLTSGTTGVPKMVVHSLAGLTAAIAPVKRSDPVVWATFYDIRRYGGLQIFLRAVIGGASLVLSHSGEPVAEHLARLARHGVTHLSGTPSHWRRALMSPDIRKIAPRYVRLSGEIADQAVLDSLRAAFPGADIGHAYASTEAGVVFAVDDGRAGFPPSFLDGARDGVEIKIVDGSLRIRSAGAASRYVGGANAAALHDSEGFVDSGDMVERQGDRYFFVGRKGGIINIGGLKVHPEEVEAVINRHPRVRMSLVRPKRSPFTGAIVVADVVLTAPCAADAGNEAELRDDILELCRGALPRHKVPAAISFVPALAVAATGKLLRRAV